MYIRASRNNNIIIHLNISSRYRVPPGVAPLINGREGVCSAPVCCVGEDGRSCLRAPRDHRRVSA